MKSKILAFLFLIFSIITNLFSEEEIRVYLSTSSSLQPIYIGKPHCTDGSLDPSYLSELYALLSFDFNYNGSTRVQASQADRENALKSASLNAVQWKSYGSAYVIKSEISNKTLHVSYLSTQTDSQMKFPPIQLTGSILRDRKTIHKLSDAIYKSLFGKEGVASTKIIYTAKHKKGDKYISEIWVSDWDGANAREITHESSLCVTPSFLNSDKFIYVSYKPGKSKIFLSSLSQGSAKRLIDLNGNQLLPAISPQRNKIAFICDVSGRTDLFMQEFVPETGKVGKPVQLFSYPRSTQASPTFSPDGSKIAFVSDKDGSPRIYLIPAVQHVKRAVPLLLTKRNSENTCPSWSPDGKKIAYSAKTKGTRQIWIYDFESGEEWQLTDGTGNKENPSWAPNSQHLVFNSTDGHVSELYLVNLNQPDVVKITSGPGVKHYPSWGK